MKRILCFLASFLFLAVVFCSAISASNNYSPGTAVYTIAYNRSLGQDEFGSVDISVSQYPTDSPISVNGTEGFIKQYFGTAPTSGFYRVLLFNGTSLMFTFSSTSFSCYYSYEGYDDTINVTLVNNISRANDFFIYVDRSGNFEICVYEITDNVPISVLPLNANLSGVIFPYNQVPGTDGTDSSYQQGYDKGYQEGVEATYSEAYNLGYARGQDTDNIVGNALSGFFNGLQGFFFPFLQIGIGSFTLSNLLGIIITVFIVIIVLKIVRG